MNFEQLQNFKIDLILITLIKTGRTLDEYKENPFFEEGTTISGFDIMETDSYKNGGNNIKSEIETLVQSSKVKPQISSSKTLSLSLRGISNVYKNDYIGEDKEMF